MIMPVKQIVASIITGGMSFVLTAANDAFRRAVVLRGLNDRPIIGWLATSSFIDVCISLFLVIIVVLIWVPYIIEHRK
jgi:hypothetical protein